MQTNNIFYNIKIDKILYFSSYLSSLIELKKLNLQPTNKINFNIMIGDLYAMKFIKDRIQVNNYVRHAVASVLACGLTSINKNVNIFCQSSTGSHHAYLAWLLSYVSCENQDNLLFCADILMYKTNLIASDFNQIKDAKLAIELAQTFNSAYKVEFFQIPQIIISPLNTEINNSQIDNFFDITVFDDNDKIYQKIKNMDINIDLSDYNLIKKLEISKLADILSVLLNITKTDAITLYGGAGITHFKNTLAEATISHITPIRNEANKLLKNNFYLSNIIQTGNQKANFAANSVIEKIKILLGL